MKDLSKRKPHVNVGSIVKFSQTPASIVQCLERSQTLGRLFRASGENPVVVCPPEPPTDRSIEIQIASRIQHELMVIGLPSESAGVSLHPENDLIGLWDTFCEKKALTIPEA